MGTVQRITWSLHENLPLRLPQVETRRQGRRRDCRARRLADALRLGIQEADRDLLGAKFFEGRKRRKLGAGRLVPQLHLGWTDPGMAHHYIKAANARKLAMQAAAKVGATGEVGDLFSIGGPT